MSWLEKELVDKSISIITTAVATSACEVAGLGPEDPLSDICAVAVSKIASQIIEQVVNKHLTQGSAICNAIHLC